MARRTQCKHGAYLDTIYPGRGEACAFCADERTLMSFLERLDVREALAEIEHQQWMYWSKTLAKKEKLSSERMARWKKLWKPYDRLSEEDMGHDRIWAVKAIMALAAIAKEKKRC